MGTFVSGNIFIRSNDMQKAGDVVVSHKHAFDHTTIVFIGAIRVRTTEPSGSALEREFVAPAHFLVRAGIDHEIIALQDGTTYWCVYPHLPSDPHETINGTRA